MTRALLMTAREAAARLGIGPVAVLDLADAGRIESEDIAGQTFIVTASLDQYARELSGVSQ